MVITVPGSDLKCLTWNTRLLATDVFTVPVWVVVVAFASDNAGPDWPNIGLYVIRNDCVVGLSGRASNSMESPYPICEEVAVYEEIVDVPSTNDIVLVPVAPPVL